MSQNFFNNDFAQTKKLYMYMYNCTLQRSKTYAMHVQTSVRLKTVTNSEECYMQKYLGVFRNIPIGEKNKIYRAVNM